MRPLLVIAALVLGLAGCSAEAATQKAVPTTSGATFTTFPPPTTSTTPMTLPQPRQTRFVPEIESAPARDWQAEELEARLDRLERLQREQKMHEQICRVAPESC